MIKLRDYQKEAVKKAVFCLKNFEYFAYLMPMGSGKTYTVLETIKQLNDNILPVICCPKALINANIWQNQIIFYYGDDWDIIVWPGNQKAKTKKFQKRLLALDNQKIIFLVNIESFQTDVKRFKFTELYKAFERIKKSYFFVIDESSKIKNHKSNRTRNICSLNYTYAAIMTGTEISNSIMDIYTQYEFLKRGFWDLRDFYAFRNRYGILQEIRINNGKYIKIVVGVKKVNEIKKRIEYCTYQITKEECLDLPEKIYQTIRLKMNKEQEKVYAHLKNELWCEYKDTQLIGKNKLSLYVAFMQIACGFFPGTGELIGNRNLKLDYIFDETEDYNKQFIIWANFRSVINFLCKRKDVNRFDGTLKENFEKKYYAINFGAGAFGLNLQFCSDVYYIQRSLSLEKNQQSEDRCHRIGQKNNVVYKDLIFENTVDEKIIIAYEKKKSMLNDFRNMTGEEFFEGV